MLEKPAYVDGRAGRRNQMRACAHPEPDAVAIARTYGRAVAEPDTAADVKPDAGPHAEPNV